MRLDLKILNKQDINTALDQQGFCLIDSTALLELTKLSASDLQRFATYWDNLVEDRYLKDLGRYRFRRHSSYKVENQQTSLMSHRAHWQSLDYNALHGGINRMFEPIDTTLNDSQSWLNLISGVASLINHKSDSNLPHTLFTEAHQFRINTMGGIGRPTPEGAHRDGVDYVAVILIKRHLIKGGETRLFNIHGNDGVRFTLEEPWSLLLIDDHRIIHETTPIQDSGGQGFRDTLILTYRSNGFQEPK